MNAQLPRHEHDATGKGTTFKNWPLTLSCGGKYDIGTDKVWDTWQIESPDFVWYFRGHPHIHGYFHLPV